MKLPTLPSGGGVAGAEITMTAWDATLTNSEICAKFMMPSDEGARPAAACVVMQEGMKPPPAFIPAFDLAMQYDVGPMMMQMIDERVGDDETVFPEELGFSLFQEGTETVGMFFNEMDEIAQVLKFELANVYARNDYRKLAQR